MTDITYRNDGLYTSFFADFKSGETVMTQLMEQNEGSNRILSIHSKAVISQIRKAGYSVKKAKKVKESDAELLSALGI